MDRLIDLIINKPESVNALAAVCALLVSLLSIILTVRTLRLQRIHNFKSLTPIASILTGDYEGELEVSIRNSGIGPLIVERLTVDGNNQQSDNIYMRMPALPDGRYWTTFSPNIEGRVIPPSQKITLLQLNGDPNDAAFAAFRDAVRHELSSLTVTVKYKDIYDRAMPAAVRELTWFARNLPKLDSQTVENES